MLRCATVRELSRVMSFCQFCDFLIYISVRFVYISFTFFFALFFPSCHAQIPATPFCLATRAICGKSLILNRFFLPKRLPKIATRAAKMLSH